MLLQAIVLVWMQKTTNRLFPHVLPASVSLIPCILPPQLQLETDQTLLGKKSSQALDKYQVDAVVGNLLHTRYDEVIVASRTGSETIARDLDVQQIESLLVSNIIDRHSRYIAKCGSACKGSET